MQITKSKALVGGLVIILIVIALGAMVLVNQPEMFLGYLGGPQISMTKPSQTQVQCIQKLDNVMNELFAPAQYNPSAGNAALSNGVAPTFAAAENRAQKIRQAFADLKNTCGCGWMENFFAILETQSGRSIAREIREAFYRELGMTDCLSNPVTGFAGGSTLSAYVPRTYQFVPANKCQNIATMLEGVGVAERNRKAEVLKTDSDCSSPEVLNVIIPEPAVAPTSPVPGDVPPVTGTSYCEQEVIKIIAALPNQPSNYLLDSLKSLAQDCDCSTISRALRLVGYNDESLLTVLNAMLNDFIQNGTARTGLIEDFQRCVQEIGIKTPGPTPPPNPEAKSCEALSQELQKVIDQLLELQRNSCSFCANYNPNIKL